MIIDNKPKDTLTEFLSAYRLVHPHVDQEKARHLIEETIAYYGGNLKQREKVRYLQALEVKWYKSLDSGIPDYSGYADPYYFTDLWACWSIYSRGYIRAIRSNVLLMANLSNVRGVLDLGCGIGYTTTALTELFPFAKVFGTNISGTEQFRFCEFMSCIKGFSIASVPADIACPIDLVFASEYFEHIEAPLDHLNELLALNPKVIITANAFGAVSYGHFRHYIVDREKVVCTELPRLFAAKMRKAGYVNEKTGFWNNRPTVWALKG